MSDIHTLLPFIVSKPYEIKILEHTINLYRIAFILETGETLWKESGTIEDILSANELVPKATHIEKDGCVLIPISTEKTKIEDFYFYEDPDAPSEGLVWRSFFYFQDTSTQASFMGHWKYPKSIRSYIDNALKIWNNIYV